MSGIKLGKLKSCEYLDVPNGKSSFRHGFYVKFSSNPVKAAVKIAASDSFGVNRRDITVFHWFKSTNDGVTTSNVNVYGANDDGHLAGRSTFHLKDNIIFKGKFYSKNKLLRVSKFKLLGSQNFGSIDKLIKIQTIVKASKTVFSVNESKVFKITVKNKFNKKIIMV